MILPAWKYHDRKTKGWVWSRRVVRGTGRRETFLKMTDRSDDQRAVEKEKSKSKGRRMDVHICGARGNDIESRECLGRW